jgi:hypothetical protein
VEEVVFLAHCLANDYHFCWNTFIFLVELILDWSWYSLLCYTLYLTGAQLVWNTCCLGWITGIFLPVFLCYLALVWLWKILRFVFSQVHMIFGYDQRMEMAHSFFAWLTDSSYSNNRSFAHRYIFSNCMFRTLRWIVNSQFMLVGGGTGSGQTRGKGATAAAAKTASARAAEEEALETRLDNEEAAMEGHGAGENGVRVAGRRGGNTAAEHGARAKSKRGGIHGNNMAGHADHADENEEDYGDYADGNDNGENFPADWKQQLDAAYAEGIQYGKTAQQRNGQRRKPKGRKPKSKSKSKCNSDSDSSATDSSGSDSSGTSSSDDSGSESSDSDHTPYHRHHMSKEALKLTKGVKLPDSVRRENNAAAKSMRNRAANLGKTRQIAARLAAAVSTKKRRRGWSEEETTKRLKSIERLATV